MFTDRSIDSVSLRAKNLRQFRIQLSLIVFSLVSLFGGSAKAEPCPVAPDSYPPQAVLEGTVIGTSTAFLLGVEPTVSLYQPSEGASRFIVSWVTNTWDNGVDWGYDQVMAAGFSTEGDCLHAAEAISTPVPPPPPNTIQQFTFHFHPSVSLSPTGHARLIYGAKPLGVALDRTDESGAHLRLTSDFEFDDSTWPTVTYPSGSASNFRPSVGISDSSSGFEAHAWAKGSTSGGLWYSPPATPSSPFDACGVTSCTTERTREFNPCTAVHDGTGYFFISWAHPETTNIGSPRNIWLQLFEPDGTPVGSSIVVNSPSLEDPPGQITNQWSPAMDIDDAGNIVVVWSGPGQIFSSGPPVIYCTEPAGGGFSQRIYARRYHWNPSSPSAPPSAVGSQFVVSNSRAGETSAGVPNPSVALSDAANRKFLVAWNFTPYAGGSGDEVHGQYFDGDQPVGKEFRINQENERSGGPDFWHRRIGHSGQHTIAYGANDKAVCVWSVQVGDSLVDEQHERVYYTILPAGYAEYQESVLCCPGDTDGNGVVTAADIPTFVLILLGFNPMTLFCQSPVSYHEKLCMADLNMDGLVDGRDIQPFINKLLSGGSCDEGVLRDIADCNQNGQPDPDDIAKGISEDCNQNLTPDECDLAWGSSADINSNEIPDECETDCNGNAVPDSWDIAQQTSNDVNSNGIPDECERDCNLNGVPDSWDISQATSADCNQDGVPDECEFLYNDCNANGVPDDCDVDPSDPDGNQQVSPDCNANGVPDECDLDRGPPFGSLDCNENGIPDECDIAECENDPACDDCNGNGIPDACDIEAAISEDANENGIPDECESQGVMSGPGGTIGDGSAVGGIGAEDGPMRRGSTANQSPHPNSLPAGEEAGEASMFTSTSPDEAAAWNEFYEWCDAQCWGPGCGNTGAEQFEAYVGKLMELGLPVGG